MPLQLANIMGGSAFRLESYFLQRAVFVVALVMAVWGIAWQYPFYVDDAYISLRYAHNLLHHGELVWNLGERVEGYTNFLFVLLVAGLGGLGLDLKLASQFIGVVAYGALLVTCYHRMTGWFDIPMARMMTAVLAAHWSLIAWAFSGLESMLAVLLVWLACSGMLRWLSEGQIALRQAIWVGIWAAMAILTRYDTALVIGAAGLFVLVRGYGEFRLRFNRLFLAGSIATFTVMAHFAWRHLYYGSWLPNSYIAKIAGAPSASLLNGLEYVLQHGIGLPPFIGLFVLMLVRHGWREASIAGAILRVVLIVSLAWFVYVALVGGDHFPHGRFMLILLPFWALAVAAVLPLLQVRYPTDGRMFCVLMIAALMSQPFWYGRATLDYPTYTGGLIAPYVQAHWPDDAVVALHAAGKVPYENPSIRFIDTLGLSDATIARRDITPELIISPAQVNFPGHAKGDGVYVLSRAPDYILINTVEVYGQEVPIFLTGYELLRHPEFHRCYGRQEVMLPIDRPGLAPEILQGKAQFRFVYYRRICDAGDIRSSLS